MSRHWTLLATSSASSFSLGLSSLLSSLPSSFYHSYLRTGHWLHMPIATQVRGQVLSHSAVSDSMWPPWTHRALQAPPSWGFPGKKTGVGCHALLQGIFPTQRWNPPLLCLLHAQVGSLAPPGKPQQLAMYALKWAHLSFFQRAPVGGGASLVANQSDWTWLLLTAFSGQSL